jgi:hypothetical protein
MHLITDTLATLGSRFNLVLDPHDQCIYLATYGRFKDLPVELVCGIEDEQGKVTALPFTAGAEHFPYGEQSITMTGITYRALLPQDGLHLTVTFTAPFYPQDEQLSLAPFFYVDLKLEKDRPKTYRWQPQRENPIRRGKLVFALKSEKLAFRTDGADVVYEFDVKGFERRGGGVSEAEAKLAEQGGSRVRHRLSAAGAETRDNGFALAFDLTTRPAAEMSLVWNAFTLQPVMSLFGEPVPFKYTEYFPTEPALLEFARTQKTEVLKKCRFFDQQITDWSLGRDYSNMTAFAFHSFLINSWWVQAGPGQDWFSVWEGSCYFHSTIDVEYNDAMVYLTLWPELLGKLLHQWMRFQNDGAQTLGPAGAGTVFLSHDMGSGVVAGKQYYPHHMEVEENCNYLLLLFAYWRQTGDNSHVVKYAAELAKLARFIKACDLEGNGIPSTGTANTIDDASPAVQFGRHQTYLAFKAANALGVCADMARHLKNDALAADCDAQVKLITRTMDSRGWLHDHYAVTLERTTDGLTNPWTQKPLGPGKLEGWDAYSIYASNGCLYPFLTGKALPFNYARLAEDLHTATQRTMTDYGSTHSSDNQIFWVSQNQWRDYIAAYLGLDMLNNNDRYWEYQWTTGNNHQGSCFYETSCHNNLCFYPRGIAALGVVFAAAGLSLDRAAGHVQLHPLRAHLSVPLLPLADWKNQRVPWLRCSQTLDHKEQAITDDFLLKDLKVVWRPLVRVDMKWDQE